MLNITHRLQTSPPFDTGQAQTLNEQKDPKQLSAQERETENPSIPQLQQNVARPSALQIQYMKSIQKIGRTPQRESVVLSASLQKALDENWDLASQKLQALGRLERALDDRNGEEYLRATEKVLQYLAANDGELSSGMIDLMTQLTLVIQYTGDAVERRGNILHRDEDVNSRKDERSGSDVDATLVKAGLADLANLTKEKISEMEIEGTSRPECFKNVPLLYIRMARSAACAILVGCGDCDEHRNLEAMLAANVCKKHQGISKENSRIALYGRPIVNGKQLAHAFTKLFLFEKGSQNVIRMLLETWAGVRTPILDEDSAYEAAARKHGDVRFDHPIPYMELIQYYLSMAQQVIGQVVASPEFIEGLCANGDDLQYDMEEDPSDCRLGGSASFIDREGTDVVLKPDVRGLNSRRKSISVWNSPLAREILNMVCSHY